MSVILEAAYLSSFLQQLVGYLYINKRKHSENSQQILPFGFNGKDQQPLGFYNVNN